MARQPQQYVVFFLVVLSICHAFAPLPVGRSLSCSRNALPTPEESAKALTDYMAKAHEEKIRAMKTVEDKFKAEIEELKSQVASLEGSAPVKTGETSFEMPATNKMLTQKVESYQNFLAAYIVKAQNEKVKAVAAAEKQITDKYEAIIAEMKGTAN